MAREENLSRVEVESATDLRDWLEANYGQEESVWLVTYKKVAADKYVSTSEVLDELLCFGWIDGRRMKLDDQRTMQLISPRRVQHWSKTYKDRAAKLEREGRMKEPGRVAIQKSKSNGLWNLLDDVDALIQPEDLKQALTANDAAKAFFDALPPASMRFALRWIKLAKSDKTRANRIGKVVELSAQRKKVPGS
ncbi:MAG: YdeI/OmpD-associated family protein [Bacteroidota bacterium]